jgi:thiamine biosynthesis lipoprotein
MTESFKALGTIFHIELFDTKTASENDAVLKIVRDCAHEFESKYSRFNKNSLLYQLSEHYLNNPQSDPYALASENYPSEVEFLAMLEYSKKVNKFSDGKFDIRVGSLLSNLGYDNSQKFNDNNKKISVEQVTCALDFGGFGKGWLVDKLSKLLLENGYKYFLINGGGDIFATSDNTKPIKTFLENPFNNSEYFLEIELLNESISGSSKLKRSWKNETATHHHLLNYLTKKPIISKLVAVHAKGKDCLTTDTACSCLFYCENDEEVSRVADHFGIRYVMIFEDQTMISNFSK